jgi:HlyD family secretion protein
LGAVVMVTAEGYPPRRFRARVEEIADTVVPRRLRPEDPGRSADSRVLRVKIAFREPCTLKLGQRVEIAIADNDEAKVAAKRE